MSRMATAEYIGAKRRAYLDAPKNKRSKILSEVCETTGYERKYANKLLLGIRKFKERKGRGKTGNTRHNRRSGYNWQLLHAIECKSGEEIMACRVAPGDTQVDTVALCGGDMGGNFWWILTATDRKTQWTEIQPTWNHGIFTTLDALKAAVRRLPFPVRSLHHDNGREFVNEAVAEYFGVRKRIPLSRSRFRRKNDNAHVEQKNGSVVRELFGEGRIDDRDLGDDLVRLCREYADYRNFCVPCKMLVAKVKRPSGKGFATRYDAPKTPCQRVLDDPDVGEDAKDALRRRKAEINGIELFHRLRKRLRRIRARQEAHRARVNDPGNVLLSALRGDSALRAAPSGTSPAAGVEVGGISLLAKPPSWQSRIAKSVQYLTNAKSKRQLLGVRTT